MGEKDLLCIRRPGTPQAVFRSPYGPKVERVVEGSRARGPAPRVGKRSGQSEDGKSSGSEGLVREETESAVTHHVGGQSRGMGEGLDMKIAEHFI